MNSFQPGTPVKVFYKFSWLSGEIVDSKDYKKPATVTGSWVLLNGRSRPSWFSNERIEVYKRNSPGTSDSTL
jgi:hypothetical protein